MFLICFACFCFGDVDDVLGMWALFWWCGCACMRMCSDVCVLLKILPFFLVFACLAPQRTSVAGGAAMGWFGVAW